MRLLILGCGRLGSLVAGLACARGHHVHGVRRTAQDADFPTTVGNAADQAVWDGLGSDWQTVVLAATPGVRRGRDNALDRIAAMVSDRLPAARLVYTGSTAVYGDAGGAPVAEDGPIAGDARQLLAIERAVLAQPDALVLRLPALVGASRDRAVERARTAAAAAMPLTIPGDPTRPFSVIHERDAAEIVIETIAGGKLAAQRGILNAASPQRLSARDYYLGAAQVAGVTVEVASDGTRRPARAIDASRLHRLLPGRTWHGPWDA